MACALTNATGTVASDARRATALTLVMPMPVSSMVRVLLACSGGDTHMNDWRTCQERDGRESPWHAYGRGKNDSASKTATIDHIQGPGGRVGHSEGHQNANHATLTD